MAFWSPEVTDSWLVTDAIAPPLTRARGAETAPKGWDEGVGGSPSPSPRVQLEAGARVQL